MPMALDRFVSPPELPARWDDMAGTCFQRRVFLSHCERYNPCAQRYFVLSDAGSPVAGAIVYTLAIDLLTFLHIKSPLRMHIVGIPCSVSSSGIVGEEPYYSTLLEHLAQRERGLLLCLNIDHPPPDGGPMIIGRTWPTIGLQLPFASWDDYRRSLRSPYRRRLRQIERKAAEFDIRVSGCGEEFSPEHYLLYEMVYCRSRGKLEKLTAGFFINLPDEFVLTTFRSGGAVRGWTIAVNDGNECCYFFLGGQEYSGDPSGLYHVKLMHLLRHAIESGVARIDFGQSAEVPKMRFGGRVHEKVMLARHGNPLMRRLLHTGRHFLSYNKLYPRTTCFKEDVSC
jgi:hypothetical protein